MKILKSIVILVLLIGLAISGQAQEKNSKAKAEESIKSQKIAFFTDKIGLTLEEAQVFWPIYNEYWDKKNKLISLRKEKMTYYAENSENMSDVDKIKYADEYIGYELKLAKLLEEYHEIFKKKLPIDKVMKLQLADHEFKTYLLKKIREGGFNK